MNGKTIVFMVLLLLMFSSYVIPIKKGETNFDVSPFVYFVPPVNSFGMSSYQEVNWSYFDDNFFYDTNAEELEVEWDKDDDQTSKFKYKFKTEYYDLYYLNISLIDDNIMDIDFNENLNTFNISYLDGIIYFNFTDIMITTGFEYDYILNNNGFKLILYNYLDVGEWELDPTFGCTSILAGTAYIYDGFSNEEKIYGGRYTMGGSDGLADNITLRTKSWGQTAYVQCAIYESVDCSSSGAGDLVATTNQVQVLSTDDNKWIVFPFSDPKPCLSASTDYYIVAAHITDLSGGSDNCIPYATGTCGIYKIFSSGAVLSDPLTGETVANNEYSIYCSYTEGCDEGCSDECFINESSESPVNGTTGLSPCSTINSSIWVEGNCGIISWVNVSVNGVGYHNVTSPSNGSFWYNNTSPVCGTTYTWWVNTSCNGSLNSSYYTYATESCCVITNESFEFNGVSFNQSVTCFDYNLTYLNVSGYINSSCNTTVDFVNWTLTNHTGVYVNSSQWTTESEGLYWTNWSLSPLLVCNHNYTLYVNVSTNLSDCNNYTVNNTYYFWTCPCYTPPSCDCTVDDVYPVNGTTGLNWSTNNYFNLTADINVTCGNFTNMYGNISVVGIGYNNVSLSANGTIFYNMSNNYTCGTNYTFWVNITGPQCNNTTWYWFRSEACNVSDVECCDCFNNSCFMYHLNLSIYNYLVEHKYITEDSSMEIEFGSTLVAFLLWFFLVLLTIRSKNVNIVGFSAAIQMLFALYLFNNTSLFAEADILILFFAVFIMAFGAGRIIDFRGKNKKKGLNGRRYR